MHRLRFDSDSNCPPRDSDSIPIRFSHPESLFLNTFPYSDYYSLQILIAQPRGQNNYFLNYFNMSIIISLLILIAGPRAQNHDFLIHFDISITISQHV